MLSERRGGAQSARAAAAARGGEVSDGWRDRWRDRREGRCGGEVRAHGASAGLWASRLPGAIVWALLCAAGTCGGCVGRVRGA
eukprot:3525192-Prymnesium_polylepis.1